MIKIQRISIVFLVTILVVMVLEAESVFLPKRLNLGARERVYQPKKRPFCNAFTGCGRKRSNLPALTEQGEVIDESLGSLFELSAEPAVENLSRQIMSEAKLWEAIQEANVELKRRREEASLESGEEEVPVPARSATASCALPPCYI